MRIDILCLFPGMFTSPLEQGIINRAEEQGVVDIVIHNIRDYTHDKHHTVDDSPYGGGPGMVIKVEPVFEAVEAIKQQLNTSEIPIILLTPQGKLFTQQVARELALHSHLMLICGHYEGVDERVRQHLATDELSIGDYVLTGGELAAMVIMDAVTRLLPGVLGDPTAAVEDSHARGLLEGPHYTRPRVFRGWEVPEILLSGDHAAVARWRREEALRRTSERRPDLLDAATLTSQDREFLERLLEKSEGQSAPGRA